METPKESDFMRQDEKQLLKAIHKILDITQEDFGLSDIEDVAIRLKRSIANEIGYRVITELLEEDGK